MFINPVSSDLAPQIAKQTSQKVKQFNSFFSAHAPIGVGELGDKVTISKVTSEMPIARMLGIPKDELEKIKNIFW